MRWLSFWLVTMIGKTALATTVQAVGVAEMAAKSSLVVVGTAGDGESYWEGGRIFTRLPVDVEEVLVGPADTAAVVEVTTLGGVVGEIGQKVAGEMQVQPGERVALFLRKNDAGAFVPVAMAQSVFHAEPGDAVTARIVRDAGGAHVVGPPVEADPSTLAELKSRVAEARRGDQ